MGGGTVSECELYTQSQLINNVLNKNLNQDLSSLTVIQINISHCKYTTCKYVVYGSKIRGGRIYKIFVPIYSSILKYQNIC